MTEFYEAISQAAELSANCLCETDYLAEDGMWHCGECHEPKQASFEFFGVKRTVFCMCPCGVAEYERKQVAWRISQMQQRIKELREAGITDESARKFVFDNAEDTPEVDICRNYVDNWKFALENNKGLLFWGEPGYGKTFAACCIANALIDQGVSAVVTSFPRILRQSNSDQQILDKQIKECGLLVIDDLGVERKSDYASETVYQILDERYKAQKPIILTTNLHPKAFADPNADDSQRRISTRVLAWCRQIKFKSKCFRAAESQQFSEFDKLLKAPRRKNE